MKLLHIVTAAAVALTAPPLIGGSGLPLLDDHSAAFAGKGNGNGNGGGNSNAGGNNGGNKGGKSASNSSKSKGSSAKTNKKSGGGVKLFAGNGKGNSKLKKQMNNTLAKLGLTKKKTKTTRVVRAAKPKAAKKQVTQASAVAVPKKKPLQAELKGLNSLNRNVNGFLNGNDKKLNPLRDFVMASAGVAALQTNLADANEQLALSQETLDGIVAELGLTGTDTETQREELTALESALLADEPALDAENRAAWEEELAAVQSGLDAVDQVDADREAVEFAETEVADAEGATSDEALREAIAESMSATGNRTVAAEDVSDEVFDFVSDKLGVGDAEGYIDVVVEREANASEDDDVLEPIEVLDPETEVEDPLLVPSDT